MAGLGFLPARRPLLGLKGTCTMYALRPQISHKVLCNSSSDTRVSGFAARRY